MRTISFVPVSMHQASKAECLATFEEMALLANLVARARKSPGNLDAKAILAEVENIARRVGMGNFETYLELELADKRNESK